MKIINVVLAALLFCQSAYADNIGDLVGVGVKPEVAEELDAIFADKTSGTLSGTTTVTGDITQSAGKGLIQAPSTVVFIATPVAGTNKLLPGYNVPAPTATASTKVFIGEAAPTPGTKFDFYNASAATLHLAVPTVSTLNGATQGGYLAVATKLSATCLTTSGTNIDCRLNVNPTPAGP